MNHGLSTMYYFRLTILQPFNTYSQGHLLWNLSSVESARTGAGDWAQSGSRSAWIQAIQGSTPNVPQTREHSTNSVPKTARELTSSCLQRVRAGPRLALSGLISDENRG